MDENLTIGEVISGTIETFTSNIRPFALYIAVFSTIGFSIEYGATSFVLGQFDQVLGFDLAMIQQWLGFGAGLAGIVIFILSIVGQYLLWEAVLRDSVLDGSLGKHRYLAFFGLAILMGIGTAFGILLFVIPGLLVFGRWAMAPALMIGENRGVIEALSESWDAIKGNTTPIILAAVVGWLAILVLSSIVAGGSVLTARMGAISPISMFMAQVVANFSSTLAVALGVFLFKRLRGNADRVSEVFS